MKKPITQRIGDFIAGRGFYIVLFLCVAAIGISGYFLYTSLSSAQDVAAEAPARVTVTPPPSPSVSIAPEKPAVESRPSPSPNVTPSPSVSPSPQPKPAPSTAPAIAPSYAWPVDGEIIHDFSLEVLAYDETMGDWRTHSGLDLAAEAGTPVRAVSSGTVTEVYEDDLMGVTVVIDHGGGLSSIYCDLAPEPAVAVGDDVLTGDVIASVGHTALAESSRPSHLHFEIHQDGIAADPEQYLPD